jgi:fibronectin-binding autotransporter adhesin
MKTSLLPILSSLALLAASAQAATYTFNGTGNSTVNWSANSTWSPSGTPGLADDVVIVSAGASTLGIIGNQSASTLNATSLTSGFNIVGNAAGNNTLTIDTLNKSGANNLSIRNSSNNSLVLSANITTINLSGTGDLNFGASQATNIAAAQVGTLTLNSSATNGLFYFGADNQSFSISSANITSGNIVLRNISTGNTTLSIDSLNGSGGSIRAANSSGGNGSTGFLKLSNSNGTASYAGTLINGQTASTLHVEKTNAGTQGLSGINTYTGSTRVTAGTLLISGGGSINNTSGITVEAGATFNHSSSVTNNRTVTLNGAGSASKAVLAGNGTFSGSLVLNDLGDTLAPGNNATGVQRFSTAQIWTSFSYDFKLKNFMGSVAGTDFDQIAITGGLTLDGSAYQLNLQSLTLAGAAGPVGNFSETNTSWTILTTSTGITGFNAASWTVNTDGFSTSPSYTGSFSLGVAGNNLVLSYNAIPEPSSLAMLVLGLFATGVTVARMRKSGLDKHSKIKLF